MKKGEVKKGYKAFRNTFKEDTRALKRLRNCETCAYNELEDDRGEPMCSNSNVTSFDMVYEEEKQYCSYWMPSWEDKNKF